MVEGPCDLVEGPCDLVEGPCDLGYQKLVAYLKAFRTSLVTTTWYLRTVTILRVPCCEEPKPAIQSCPKKGGGGAGEKRLSHKRENLSPKSQDLCHMSDTVAPESVIPGLLWGHRRQR